MRRLLLALLFPVALHAQPDRGATALAHELDGLGVTTRVLMIGAHPDDEDTGLIAWLARGRYVETAYLSLTRGDGGQNLVGNELGEGLGAIRTEELLAARRLDGARQYFTRAFDFGFSKTIEDTYAHWPKDTILGDVVRVVRAFRPHVIVAVFSGTPRDGHGHHQVSGLLAREVYDAAADAARYPAAGYGAPWTVAKFYRQRTYWGHEGATYRYDGGEYDPVLGMSYAEIAARSRSQHKSQAFGRLEPRGAVTGSVMREATRVNERTPAAEERGLFDGIDTTWARFRPLLADPARRAALDSLPTALAAARAALDVRRPQQALPALAHAQRLLGRAACGVPPSRTTSTTCMIPSGSPLGGDLFETQRVTTERLQRAVQLAAGLELLAVAPRRTLPLGVAAPVRVTLWNRGPLPAVVRSIQLEGAEDAPLLLGRGDSAVVLPGDSLVRDGAFTPARRAEPWWLASPRRGAMFDIGTGARTPEGWREQGIGGALVRVEVGGASTLLDASVVRRYADPVKGELQPPAAAVPAISVTLDDAIQYAPARTPLDRIVRVSLRSADTASRQATVRLALPQGLAADTLARTVTLAGHDARATLDFRVRGQLPPGRHELRASVESGGVTFADGYVEIAYDHIRPQRLYRAAATTIQAVELSVPRGLRVAYVPGVGDNVAPTLAQLGVDATVIPADQVAGADLSGYQAVVLGPRVYEANPALAAANARLLDWTRAGGTLVVQYQQDIARPGRAPFPLTLAPRAERVTEEDAAVTLLSPAHPLLAGPNRIAASDFAGWVQERALYMPSSFDAAYVPLLAMADEGMAPNRGALLVAPLGKGQYVLTTLAFFRQLPAGNPGAARLFVNLLAGGQGATAAP